MRLFRKQHILLWLALLVLAVHPDGNSVAVPAGWEATDLRREEIITAPAHQASRQRPVEITGHLSFASPPRVGQSSTLVAALHSQLTESVQTTLVLRVPEGITLLSEPRLPAYFPAAETESARFALRFDREGTFPIQLSVYGMTFRRHFILYVQLQDGRFRISRQPLPGEVLPPPTVIVRKTQQAAGVTVEGRVTYFDDNEQAMQPIRQMSVELWEANVARDQQIDETSTGDDGSYHFPTVENVDPEDGSHRDLYVVAVFENQVLRVTDVSERTYTLQSDVLQDTADGRFEVDLALDETHNRRAAGHIFNTMTDAHDWFVRQTGWERPLISVIWPTDKVGSFYSYYTRGQVFSDEIHIDGMDAWERITMLHEYGHAVMSAAYDNDFDRIPSSQYDQPHFVDTVSDPEFALSEGWAEFMEAAADDNALQLAGYSNRQTPNVEENAWYTGAVDGTGTNRDGNIVEGAVASIFWDITDTAQSIDLSPGVDDDAADGLFAYAWQILTEDFPQDILSLGERWRDRGLPEYAAVEAIFLTHGVALRSNQPPTLADLSPAVDTFATRNQPLTWQASDPDGDALQIDLFFDRDTQPGGLTNIVRGADASIDQYLWNTAGLPDGVYHIFARVTDVAGESVDAYSPGRFIIDATPLLPPTIESATHPDPEQWVANSSPEFTFLSDAIQFSFVLDTQPDTEPDTEPDTTDRTLAFENLADGIWWLHVRGYDLLSYWSEPAHYAVRIHTQKPPTPPQIAWQIDGEVVEGTARKTDLELVWEPVTDVTGTAEYELRIQSEAAGVLEIDVPGESVQYAFSAEPDQTYEAQVRAVNGVGLAGNWSKVARISVESAKPWDVNDDQVVDILDLTLVALSFGSAVEGSPAENPDITGDGWVDVLDLVAVGQHFGEAYGAAAPRLTTTRSGIVALPNFPNPFNPETWIPFVALGSDELRARIYDATGRPIRQIDLGYRTTGVYVTRSDAVYWDGRTETGMPVASGIYFCELLFGDARTVRKLVVLR